MAFGLREEVEDEEREGDTGGKWRETKAEARGEEGG